MHFIRFMQVHVTTCSESPCNHFVMVDWWILFHMKSQGCVAHFGHSRFTFFFSNHLRLSTFVSLVEADKKCHAIKYCYGLKDENDGTSVVMDSDACISH